MTIKLPGLIDPHVHLRDPGQTDKEDFTTGTAAALAGGYTTIVDMPNNSEPITTYNRLRHKQQIAKEKILCDVGFYFGTLGENTDEFEKIQKNNARVLGLKIYLNQTTGNFLLDKKHLESIFTHWPESLPILFHAEEETFDAVLQILEKNPRKIHLCHMSTRYELEKVIKAKENGLPVTCGVTPHHLFLSEDDESLLGPFGKMRPPLRPRSDVDFLWKHLAAIDCIESDHAPHTRDEKLSSNPPHGIPGLETSLPLLLTEVNNNKVSLDDVVRLCSTGPASLLNLQSENDTYSEIELHESYTIKQKSLFTKCKWTPFNGWDVQGRVKRVFIRGTLVYEDGAVLVNPGFGEIV